MSHDAELSHGLSNLANVMCKETGGAEQGDINSSKEPEVEFNGEAKISEEDLPCQATVDTLKAENNGRRVSKNVIGVEGIVEIDDDFDCEGVSIKVTDIYGVKEVVGDSNVDEISDAEEAASSSQSSSKIMSAITSIETTGGESIDSGKYNDESVCEESVGAEQDDSSCVKELKVIAETKGREVEFNSAEKLSVDKLACQESADTVKSDNQRASKNVIEVEGSVETDSESDGEVAFNTAIDIHGVKDVGGNSSVAIFSVSEESADSRKVVTNVQRSPNVNSEIESIKKGGQLYDSRKYDDGLEESVGAEQEDTNGSKEPDITIKINGIEDEFDGAEKFGDDKQVWQERADTMKVGSDDQSASINVIEFDGAEKFGDDKLVWQESADTVKAGSDDQSASINVIEVEGSVEKEGEVNDADGSSDGNTISTERKNSEVAHNGNRMVCDVEICDCQKTLADLEFSEAAITDVTSGNETLNCLVEIDERSPKIGIEIAGVEKTGGASGRIDDDKLICEQSADIVKPNTEEVLTTLIECSSVDAVAGQDMNGSVRASHFLIKMPRFDDEILRERIRVAELQFDEMTHHRDAFRHDIRNKRANCENHGLEFEAAKTEERAARRLVSLKRLEIASLQHVIDRAKNALATGKIDARIYNMENMIGHETLSLNEENLLVREIKQLKQLREQLSSNNGSEDKVEQVMDDRDKNEERLKILRKELDKLKATVSKAETRAVAASKKYEAERQKLIELQAQFKAADGIRQVAYEELRYLRKELHKKNAHFRMNKRETTRATEYALKREVEALNHLCINQVERCMELWNKDDEFRKQYITHNTRSTLRRFGTFDGRTLGPDEEPAVPPSYVNDRVDMFSLTNVDYVSQTRLPQQENQAIVTEDESKIMLRAEEVMNEPKEQVHLQTPGELEPARKEEELKKLEADVRSKEQRRLEEISKAKEALERKKRNAEKSQLRAELRAQKEEELRLKEREKRLRKKERKKENESNDGDTALIINSLPKTFIEEEGKEYIPTITRKPQKPCQYTKQSKTKSIPPPPLRNRGRRRLQQWMWVIFTSMLVTVVFVLGNIGFFSNFSYFKYHRSPRF